MKPCATCKQLLPISSYHRNVQHKDGYQTNCRDCVAAYGRRHYKENCERYALRQQRFYQANKERMDAKHREWAERNKEQISMRRKLAYPKHRDRILAGRRKYKFLEYGITEEIFKKMVHAQSGVCAICGSEFSGNGNKRACVDHDHTCCKGSKSCGKCIRGILCFNCNTFLGHARDSLLILQRAINYLREFEKEKVNEVPAVR